MLVVFVLDTSASMAQRVAGGLTLLDCAKSAVEHFHRVRQRDAACRMDRYMLVTFEDGPDAIKLLDKYPFQHLLWVLRSIQARDLTSTGAAVQRTFDLLHLQRLAADVDRYGLGRNPCSIDPTMVMLLTDGTELTSLSGVASTMVLPGGPVPVGSDLAMQPFRWDQRVFATILRIPSVGSAMLERCEAAGQPNTPASNSQAAIAMDGNISAFCEVTGGKCVVVTSWKVLMQHTEMMASRLQPCCLISFDQMPLSGAAPLPPHVHATCQRKLLFVRGGQGQGQGHWPIPEAYWPDPYQAGLPSREAHPTLSYKPVDCDPSILHGFPFDKYEVESNAITGMLLKAPPNICWQVFVRNSKGTNHGYGDPFGYLKANRVGNTLALYVLPYNYPALFQLLEQLAKIPGQGGSKGGTPPAPPKQWLADMERYCAGVPSYYGLPLRLALKRRGLSNIVPDSMDALLMSGFIGTQLKRIRAQAKAEVDSEMARLLQNSQAAMEREPLFPSLGRSLRSSASADQESEVVAPQASGAAGAPGEQTMALETPLGEADLLVPTQPSSSGVAIAALTRTDGWRSLAIFHNPFDVPKEHLLEQLLVLPLQVALALGAGGKKAGKRDFVASGAAKLAARLAAEEGKAARHSVPIEKMGDFNEALLKQQPPRNPYIDDADRNKQARTMFGNPYRQDKSDAGMSGGAGGGADEAWLEGPDGPVLRGPGKRRRSPSLGPQLLSAGDGDSIAAGKIASPADGVQPVALETAALVPPVGQNGARGGDEEAGEIVGAMEDGEHQVLEEEQSRSSAAASGQASMRHDQVVKPSGKLQAHTDVVKFLLSILSAIKSRSSSREQIFELLEAPDFPVDKQNFVQQLVLQAQRCKKRSLVVELSNYLLTAASSQA